MQLLQSLNAQLPIEYQLDEATLAACRSKDSFVKLVTVGGTVIGIRRVSQYLEACKVALQGGYFNSVMLMTNPLPHVQFSPYNKEELIAQIDQVLYGVE